MLDESLGRSILCQPWSSMSYFSMLRAVFGGDGALALQRDGHQVKPWLQPFPSRGPARWLVSRRLQFLISEPSAHTRLSASSQWMGSQGSHVPGGWRRFRASSILRGRVDRWYPQKKEEDCPLARSFVKARDRPLVALCYWDFRVSFLPQHHLGTHWKCKCPGPTRDGELRKSGDGAQESAF